MRIPHEVVARVKSWDGTLGLKQGDQSMHAIGSMTSKCPKCKQDRESTFRRQGTSAEGKLYLWNEHKCFDETCKISWIEVYRLDPVPHEPEAR